MAITIEKRVKDFLIWKEGIDLYKAFEKNVKKYHFYHNNYNVDNINNGFHWGDTKEGHHFWSELEYEFQHTDEEEYITEVIADTDMIHQEYNF